MPENKIIQWEYLDDNAQWGKYHYRLAAVWNCGRCIPGDSALS